MSNNTQLKRKLQQIIHTNPNCLRAEVAAEALHFEDDIAAFFTDLSAYGCQSGMVGKLIYYTDTHQFYDKHYNEIETLREELEDAFGEALRPNGDLKNWFAWMAFEETARIMAQKLQL